MLKSMQWTNRLAFSLLTLSLVTACGFHLRGAYDLPPAMQQTTIDIAQPSSLSEALKRRLQASGIEVLPSASDQVAVLKIHQESRSKRIVSVDVRGRAREYALIYQLRFSVKNASMDFEIPEQSLKIERDFLFDSEAVLGNQQGEEALYASMESDLLRLLMLKLQSPKLQNSKL